MTKQEAKRWATQLAVAVLRNTLSSDALPDDESPDSVRKIHAFRELIRELARRAGEYD